MSILVIVDSGSKEQIEKLQKLQKLLGKKNIVVSGYKMRRLKSYNIDYVNLNSFEYIESLLTCEIVILLTKKISFLKYNKFQIIISWFDKEIMKENFNNLSDSDKLKLIDQYHLDVMIGVQEKYKPIDSFFENEYNSIVKYIEHKEYSINVFNFDASYMDEDELVQSEKLEEMLSDKNSVNLLIYKGSYSQYFTSKFDCIVNNYNAIIAYLENKFDITNLKNINQRNINIINEEFSMPLKTTSKKQLYLSYLEKKQSKTHLPLVSIIIPHYNTEQNLLFRAIDSVLDNKYRNIEIIIVDDGSKEDLQNIVLSQYHNKKIKFIRQDNAGPGIARNTGVKQAKGKYIFFIDADDTITINGLYYLVLHAEIKKVKMVSGKTVIVDESGLPINISLEYLFNETYKCYESKDISKVFYAQMVHGKLLHKDIFLVDNIWFKPGLYEDSLWTMELYGTLDHFDFLNIVSNHWYKYEQRETLSSTATLNNFKERFRAYNEIIKICNKRTTFQKTNFFFRHEISMYFENYEHFTPNEKKEFFALLQEFVKTKGTFLDINSNIYYKVLQEAIELDRFNEFEYIINMNFSKKLSDNEIYDNYIAFTHYQLMVSIVYALENKKPARLYLNTGYVTFNDKLVENLKKIALFSKVIVFENKESGKLIEQLIGSSEEPKYIIPNILYTPYKKIFSDIKPIEDIYIFNSTLPYWYYIGRTKKNLIKLEDGYNSIMNEVNQMTKHGIYFELLEKHIPTIYPDSALHFANKIIISKEYDKLPNKLRDKVSVVDTKELIKKNFNEYRKILISIYPPVETGSKNACLILTQPLDKVLYCTTEEKSKLYRKMISEYKKRGPVYIKPHPADDYPYGDWWGARVLDKDTPLEVYDIKGFKCETAVTFGSTSIDTLNFAKNKIVIYQDDNTSREKVTLKIQEYIAGYRDSYDLAIYKDLQKVKNKLKKINKSHRVNKAKQKFKVIMKRLKQELMILRA